MGGTQQHSQVDESGSGPLIHSFSELGQLVDGDSAESGFEEIRNLVVDVLTDYADRDVYVQDDDEPGAFTIRVRTRGTSIPYPFTSAEVYDVLDDLVQEDDANLEEESAARDEDD